jgi:hypothetical protein
MNSFNSNLLDIKLSDWSRDNLLEWLKSIELEDYIDVFDDHHISGYI